MKKILFSFIMPAFIFISSLQAQDTDYKKLFAKDWIKAEAFISANESWMKRLCDKYDISYPVAAAIVFPELVRYSALRDRIEITMLKTLYINLGDEYADFSIGPFQMKPSFAQTIHEKAPLLKDRIRKQFRAESDTGSTREFRTLIVNNLEHPQSQLIYLVAFIKICDALFDFKNCSDDYRLKMLSTAYNCGLKKNVGQIILMSDKKFFSTKLYKSENYCYSDISLFWYHSYIDRQKIR